MALVDAPEKLLGFAYSSKGKLLCGSNQVFVSITNML